MSEHRQDFHFEDACLESFSKMHFTFFSRKNKFKKQLLFCEYENKAILGNTAFNCGKQKLISEAELKNSTKFP